MCCRPVIINGLVLSVFLLLTKSKFGGYAAQICANLDTYSVSCLKRDLAQWVSSVERSDSYALLPGVTLIRDAAAVTQNKSHQFSATTNGSTTPTTTTALLRSFGDILRTRTIRLRLNSETLGDDLDVGRKKNDDFGFGGGGGGGGNKGGEGMSGLFLAGAMLKATFLALTLGGLAAVAGKAIMASLISIVISAVIGAKALTYSPKQTTFEVVPKPVITHEDHIGGASHYSHGGLARFLDSGSQ